MTTTPPAEVQRIGGYTVMVAGVAALAGLLFGFDTAVVNGALVLLRAEFHLDDWQSEQAAGALLLGALIGAAMAGWSGDRFGRRNMLTVSGALFALSSLASALPQTLFQFEAARLAGGLAIGITSTLSPIYIAEISPPAYRGRLVSLYQLAIVVGILLSFFLCWRLAVLGPGAWRWMFGIGLIPSLVLMGGLCLIPESPRWLYEKGRRIDARVILGKILGEEEAAREEKEIERLIEQEHQGALQVLSPDLRRPLVLAVMLAVLQQFTGINTVLYYGSILLTEHAHQGTSSAIGASVLIGLVNLLGTFVALALLDRAGRRLLLLITLAMMAVSLTVLALSFYSPNPPFYLVLGSILTYVGSFAIGPGPVTWVYISEIFPSAVRGRAVSIATFALWAACLLVTVSFLSLLKILGPSGTFFLYAGVSVFTFFFVWRGLPETRGKTLEEISTSWKG
jgi:SP family arabinose:H+ symporter-like MFS transporter